MNSIFNQMRNSRFRDFIWPIRSKEFFKFFPMAILMFAILLNQNIVRIMKDSIVMTLVGPEVISFIKLWGEMPIGILFVIVYAKLCNRLSTEKVFRLIVSAFIIGFSIFIFVIFPNSDLFHPDPLKIAKLIEGYPHLKWFIIIWSKWSYILFYIMGELWPIIVFSLLFWQLANKITKTEEAGRFYSFFSLFGQSNLLISGSVILYFKSADHYLMYFFENLTDKTEIMLKSLTVVVIATGVILNVIHYYIEKFIMSDERYYQPIKVTSGTLQLGFRKSLRLIASSKYLGWICVLIISYGMAVNLIEGIWMSKIRDLHQTPEGFMSYQGTVLFWTGIFTLICALLGSTIIRHFGWYTGAIITPVMMLIVGAGFFVSVKLEHKLEVLFSSFGALSTLVIINFIGALQNVLGKGTKYSVFDATKEMAYIPLDDEMKTKGKAAVDVLGSKIGKSAGAIVQFGAFTIFPNAKYDDIAGFLGVFYVIICVVWILAVKKLAKNYDSLIKDS